VSADAVFPGQFPAGKAGNETSELLFRDIITTFTFHILSNRVCSAKIGRPGGVQSNKFLVVTEAGQLDHQNRAASIGYIENVIFCQAIVAVIGDSPKQHRATVLFSP
jgi:hypothetical protein